MFWKDQEDFDDDLFNDDHAGDEALGEIKKEQERINNLPLMIQANQVFDVVQSLVATLPENEDVSDHFKEVMLTDVRIICGKISAAECSSLYSVKMENAVMVKIAAVNLLAQTSGLSMLCLAEQEYIDVLRDEIEEFKILFIEWISTFSRRNDMDDGWKLFQNAPE